METTTIDTQSTIQELETAFAEALSRGEVDAAVSGFYADHAQFHAPNAPPAIGAAQIRGALQSFVDGGLRSLRLTTIDFGGGGDVAWNRGRYELTMETPDGTVEDVGTFVTIFEPQDNGLRCVVDIFNSDQAA